MLIRIAVLALIWGGGSCQNSTEDEGYGPGYLEDAEEATMAHRAEPRYRDNIQRVSAGSGSGPSARAWRSPDLGLHWLANIYNPYRWNPNNLPGARLVSGQCRSTMKLYLTALDNGTLWATHMTDASGRYSSQFFFGNDFWLGSKRECLVMQTEYWRGGPLPPFTAGYHVAVVKITLPRHLTPTPRIMTIGMCLPAACSPGDIKALLMSASSPAPPAHELSVIRVRQVPANYSSLSDPKLHILSIATAIVLFVMIVGTIYEVVLERKRRHIITNNNESLKLDSLEKIVYDKRHLTKSNSHLDNVVDPCQGFGKVRDILMSFSVISNGRKILHCGAAPQDSLTCIHGLRFLSIIWVIMVHTYLQIFAIAENKERRSLAEKSLLFQTVSNATFSVDTFFFISGLLVAYLYLKSTTKPDGEGTIRAPRTPKPFVVEVKSISQRFFVLVGYRFIRLTPAYMFVLGLAELGMRYLKNSSVFEPVSLDNDNCNKYWWRNMLYINSLFPRNEMCMLWSWYMANDTQFYVLGILLLLLSTRYFRVAVSGLVLILMSSWITTGLVAAKFQYLVRVDDPFQLFDELYDKPWMRIGPYLVGMSTGWYLHRCKVNLRISKFSVVSGWLLSLVVMCGLVYGVRDARPGVTGSAVYAALGHTAWGAALSWIVIACCSGYGGCINSVLSCRLLHPLSRLTYCAYLVHPVMMAFTIFQMEAPFHLNQYIVITLYFGNVVGAFLLSFFISITFEAPVVRLLKVLMAPSSARPQPVPPSD